MLFALSSQSGQWDGPGQFWPIFPILWLVVIAGIITAFVMTSRRRSRQSGQRAGERRLAERYAAGEIDEQEYRQRRTILRSKDS